MNNKNIFKGYDITLYGAKPDGRKLCTEAFHFAIKAASQAGGGTIYVPTGEYLTGPIEMSGNITLFLDAGAKLNFSACVEDYPVINARWEGAECPVYMPMIYGSKLENVTITGYGTLDGQGEFWWKAFRERSLDYARPRLISFEDCSRVLIEGIKLVDSPSWTVNPVRCQNVTIDTLTIINPPDSPNTDGINPDSCKNVHISNCHVDVGDDCITIKSGTEKSIYKESCENITITNCTLVHGHGGVVIGSEMSGDIRNVVISNCVFEGTDRGIRLKTRRGRGGIVEDIRVSNLVMKDVMCPIVMNQYYFCGEGGEDRTVWEKNPLPVSDATPVFRGIHFCNVTARSAHAAAAFIYGLPEMPIEDISFDNVSISMAENAVPGVPAMMSGLEPVKNMGIFCCNTKDVSFSNVRLRGCEGKPFQVKDSERVNFSECRADNENYTKE